ncbi:hypothetical protein [uncultured Aquimarina sp.]|uniref:hypothetical protein n=1 Tax=uncultured Aquimarina sp. TaxID=575652 RepID=UPI00262D4E0C|nr:hypothetical protein [uncultured Aquimarina sp.]
MYTLIIINFIEIVAAIAGTIYLKRYREDKLSRYLVFFLWFTILMELTLGWLPAGVYFLESFSFLCDTIFEDNIWVYNIYDIISFVFYFSLFSSLKELKKLKRFSFFLSMSFIVFAVVNLFLSGSFFTEPSSLNFLLGSLILLLHVIYFFFRILQSEQILDFYRIIFFYIGIGTMIFNLSVSPILIYSKYFSNARSPEFVQIYKIILSTANIFMYTCFTIGFVICLKKNRSY